MGELFEVEEERLPISDAQQSSEEEEIQSDQLMESSLGYFIRWSTNHEDHAYTAVSRAEVDEQA